MIDLDKQREVFLYELNGRGYEFENKTWIHRLGDVGNRFDDDQLNMVWEMYLAGQESKQAEIDSLKKEIEILKNQILDGFTSIEDGLPTNNQSVIAFDSIKNCVFANGEFMQEYFEQDTGYSFREPVDVTHWMLIPKGV